MKRLAVLLLLGGLFVLDCTPTGTGTTLVVTVTSDLNVGTEINFVEVVVAGGKLRYSFSLDGHTSFPIHVALIPQNAMEGPFEVQALGSLVSSSMGLVSVIAQRILVASQSGIVSFVPGAEQELVLFLGRDCTTLLVCPTGMTCEAGGCIGKDGAGIRRIYSPGVDANSSGGTGSVGPFGSGGTIGGTGGTGGTGARGGSGGTGAANGGSGSGGVGTGTGTGTGPCMGLCDNPIVFATQPYSSGDLGMTATCHETTASIQGGSCGNFVVPRTFLINGNTPENCVGAANWSALPPKIHGGYCFQASAGQNAYGYFLTF